MGVSVDQRLKCLGKLCSSTASIDCIVDNICDELRKAADAATSSSSTPQGLPSDREHRDGGCSGDPELEARHREATKIYVPLQVAVNLAGSPQLYTQAHLVWPIAVAANRIFKKFPVVEVLFYGLIYHRCECLKLVEGEPTAAHHKKDFPYFRMWIATQVQRGCVLRIWQWIRATLSRPPDGTAAYWMNTTLQIAGQAVHNRFKANFVRRLSDIELWLQRLSQQGSTPDIIDENFEEGARQVELWVQKFRMHGRARQPEGQDKTSQAVLDVEFCDGSGEDAPSPRVATRRLPGGAQPAGAVAKACPPTKPCGSGGKGKGRTG